MNKLGFLFILATLLAVNADDENTVKAKRGVALWEFRGMINCHTGKSAVWDYNRYGCWCGAGGSGTPVDATDRCCRTHDLCYQSLLRRGICTNNQWFWARYRRVGCIGCSNRNKDCGEKLCFCDQRAVQCFKRARFNARFKNYNGRC